MAYLGNTIVNGLLRAINGIYASGDCNISGTLTLSKDTDTAGAANNKPALIVGGTDTTAHIEIDGNEIMAKSSGTATGPLYLNNDGGNVYVNNKLVSLDGHIHSYLPLTGGTMTGSLKSSSNIIIDAPTGSYVEGIRINKSTAGWADIVIGSNRGTANGSPATNGGWAICTDTSNRLLISNDQVYPQTSGLWIDTDQTVNINKASITTLNGVTVGSSPKFTDTTYTGSNGISLSGTTFSNSGVRSIATGSSNGTISVNTNGTAADVAVKGLGTAAYTASTAYATASHTHNYAGSSSAGGAATSADLLNPIICASGSSSLTNIQNAFDSIPKSKPVAVLCQHGAHSMGFGWLLNGYSYASAYGGFFVSDYSTPTWIGVSNGTWSSSTILTSSSSLDAAKLTGTVPAGCYTDTKYTGANGISLSGTTFSNSGVRSIATGSTNGTISVNTNGTATDVAVKGLGTAAYTASTAYAAASHEHTYIKSPYQYSNNMLSPSITSETIFGENAAVNKLNCGFMDNHPLWNGYADVIQWTGYCKWGGTQLAAQYNTASNVRLAIRKYTQAGSKWGDWTEILTTGSSLNAAKLTGTIPVACYTNTTYTGANGISLSGTTFSNSGVRSIATGSTNGTISVNTNGTSTDVAVKGLGTAAYTASTAYATSGHTHSYLPLSGGTVTGHIIHDAEVSDQYRINRKKADGGGWAYAPIRFTDLNNSTFFTIGATGTNASFVYAYIGSGDYNSSDNLKIYSSGIVTIGGTSGTSYLQLPSGIKLY